MPPKFMSVTPMMEFPEFFNDTLEIVPVKSSEYDLISQIARLHCITFPKSLMSMIGEKSLHRYYETLTKYAEGGCLAAVIDGRVIAFLNFVECENNVGFQFLARNIYVVLPSIIFKFPVLIKLFYRQIKKVSGSLSFAYEIDGMGKAAQYKVSLLAVDPRFQSCGIATCLMKAFYQEMADRKVSMLILSVNDRNTPAIRFYRKVGWHSLKV